MKMRRSVLLFLLFFFVFHTRAIYAADEVVALKNNLLYDAAATPNLQLEIKLARRWTLEVGAGFNPFPLDDKKFPKWRHLSVSVAPRYWFCNAFHKDFISFNAAYAHYNVAGNAYPIAWMYPQIKDSRYQGDAVMGGVSYGWHFGISPHFSIELEGGVDAGYSWYDQFECKHCGDKKNHGGRWLVLPKLAVNLVVPLGGNQETFAKRCDCELLDDTISTEPATQAPAVAMDTAVAAPAGTLAPAVAAPADTLAPASTDTTAAAQPAASSDATSPAKKAAATTTTPATSTPATTPESAVGSVAVAAPVAAVATAAETETAPITTTPASVEQPAVAPAPAPAPATPATPASAAVTTHAATTPPAATTPAESVVPVAAGAVPVAAATSAPATTVPATTAPAATTPATAAPAATTPATAPAATAPAATAPAATAPAATAPAATTPAATAPAATAPVATQTTETTPIKENTPTNDHTQNTPTAESAAVPVAAATAATGTTTAPIATTATDYQPTPMETTDPTTTGTVLAEKPTPNPSLNGGESGATPTKPRGRRKLPAEKDPTFRVAKPIKANYTVLGVPAAALPIRCIVSASACSAAKIVINPMTSGNPPALIHGIYSCISIYTKPNWIATIWAITG